MPSEVSALDLAKELIGRRSITPEDGGCQEVIAKRLSAAGFKCEPMNFGAVTNLWARRGTQSPVVCFAGHTDVVPTGPLSEWHSDPFVPTIRDGKLYGRGAADMKSSIAAFVVAAEMFVKERPKHSGSIALLITSDEEGVAVDGTVKVVEALRKRNEGIDYCIVGEPSSVDMLGDTMKHGRRGSLSGKLVVRGDPGPRRLSASGQESRSTSSRPPSPRWRGRSGTRATTASRPPASRCPTSMPAPARPTWCPGRWKWTSISASPPRAPTPRSRSGSKVILKKHGLEYSITWLLGAKPFLSKRGRLEKLVVAAAKKHTGHNAEVTTTGGTSDARFIIEICPEMIELGPVNASIHKLNEHITLDELEMLPRIYLDTLRALLP